MLEAQMLDVHDVEVIKLLLDHFIAERCKAGIDSDGLPKIVDERCSCRDCVTVADAMTSCRDLPHTLHCGATSDILGLDKAASLRSIRDYLTAATAKDLSIMLTLRKAIRHKALRLPDCPSASGSTMTEGHDSHTHPLDDDASDTEFKIALVDLDMKPLWKIYEHWRLDREIMQSVLG